MVNWSEDSDLMRRRMILHIIYMGSLLDYIAKDEEWV